MACNLVGRALPTASNQWWAVPTLLMKTLSILISILASLLAGCDQPPPDAPRIPTTQVHGKASITGRVIFAAPPPPVRMVTNAPCCPGAPPQLRDESVVVNDNGTLANTFVYLEGGPRTDGSALAKKTLDQINCRYVPHAVGVVVGQTLHIRSDDRTMHNVHYRPSYSPAQNFWMSKPGDGVDTTFKAPEFIRTACDIHGWMSATIGVFDNTYFAVTGDDGTFNIAGVPAGSYTLVAWHERLGTLRQPITIANGQAITHDFSYAPPS